MKLKIRGLVFSGFAAAVFASSAMAVNPPSQWIDPDTNQLMTNQQVDDLKKTVTSQYYTDENFQGRVLAADKLDETNNVVTEKAAFIGWHYGQNGENTEWVKLEGEKALNSNGANGQNNNTEYVEIVHDNKTGNHKHYVKMNSNSIADSAALITAGGEVVGDGDTVTGLDKGRLTTAEAVYDFVKAEVQAVGDEYQPKIASNEASSLSTFNYNSSTSSYNDAGQGVMIGYRSYTPGVGGEDPTLGPSEWYIFGAKPNGVDTSNSTNNHLSYLNVTRDDTNGRAKYLVNIKSGALAEDATAISDGGTATGPEAYLDRDKLTTAKAVYDYSVKKNWGSENGGKALVTNPLTGVVELSDSPAMPGGFNTAGCENPGVHCALVSNWVVNPNETGGGHITLEWTVMAGTGS